MDFPSINSATGAITSSTEAATSQARDIFAVQEPAKFD